MLRDTGRSGPLARSGMKPTGLAQPGKRGREKHRETNGMWDMDDPEMIVLWCRSMKGRNFSKDTVTGYRRTVNLFLYWCADNGLDLGRARHGDIDRWLDSRPLGPRTRYAYISNLASFYGWLVREELLDLDPTVRVERPRLGRYLPRPAGLEAVTAAIATSPPRVAAMICCGLFGGMRRAEIARLRVEDLLLDKDPPLVLLHGKGGRERLVPLHDTTLAALRAYGLPKTGWIFPSPTTGRSLTPNYVGKLISAAFLEHVTPHQLRHLFATLSYDRAGGDIRLVQELLGHASPATTAIYTAFSQPRAAQVVRDLLNTDRAPDAA